MAGRIQAAYMLAPLVMDLADKQIPVKIVSLGHRSGAVIMVRTRFPVPALQAARRQAHRDSQPLRRRFPVPAQDAGAGEHDAERHRDRRDAAARHAGGALRQRGRRLLHRRALRRGRTARRLCAAPAHDARRMAQLHLLRPDGARGADPGEPSAGAGSRRTRCSGRASGSTPSRRTATRRSRSPPAASFFNQDPNILKFVMENPTDRVTYGDLRMIRSEFEELMQLSIEAGTIKQPDPVRELHGRELRQECPAGRDRALRCRRDARGARS